MVAIDGLEKVSINGGASPPGWIWSLQETPGSSPADLTGSPWLMDATRGEKTLLGTASVRAPRQKAEMLWQY